MQLVGALAADLDRRGRRDRQLDLAAKGREPLLQLVVARWLGLAGDRAVAVAGVGHGREVDVGQVALVEPDEARGQLGRRPREHEQEAGRERVERAGVARARSGTPAHVGDDGER